MYLLATHALCQLIILYTLLHLPAYVLSSIDELVSRIVLGAQMKSSFPGHILEQKVQMVTFLPF